ncbi:MAG: hypothetical protein NTW75_13575 [Planctomycetales bacterium]|jgi:hypothetical protein|nr:hypothetical protein [Planctomycetales bacterium]
MTPARKLTFQLASLLDLLLIVMFALYLEMQTVTQHQSERMDAERQASARDLEAVQQRLNELQQQRTQWETRQRITDQSDDSDHQPLGRIFGELFRLPESTIQKIAQRRGQDEAGLSSSDISALQKEFQSLAVASGDQVVDHLLTFVEMKKRFDVWEIYLQENGTLIVTADPHQKRLQTGVIETTTLFSDELFKLYKSFPESKSVVLILVSYGEARWTHREAVIKGLPRVSERMQSDCGGTTRFEYAVLGYRPDAVPRP